MNTRIQTGLLEVGPELDSLKIEAQKAECTVFTFKGELLYDKSALIQAINDELDFPETTVNWDALHDNLQSLCTLSSLGIILIFEYTRLFRDRDSEDFKTAIMVLESVMEYWNSHHQIFAVWVLSTK